MNSSNKSSSIREMINEESTTPDEVVVIQNKAIHGNDSSQILSDVISNEISPAVAGSIDQK